MQQGKSPMIKGREKKSRNLKCSELKRSHFESKENDFISQELSSLNNALSLKHEA